jgi:oxygen-dependent protoporphyrinogen oxidase
VLGVPTALGPLVRSGVLSPAGVARAALDVVLPRTHHGADPSVADVVGRRMGGQVVDRLVGPLVGGINAGSAERLSLRSTARALGEAADGNRSLVLGLRRRAATPAPNAGGPVFLSVAGGLERLVERLRDVLAATVDLRLGVTVTALARGSGERWRLTCGTGDTLDVDGCVLTTPAPAAARLLRPLAPEAAAHLDGVRDASVALATLGYRPASLAGPLVGSGYLVPRSEGRLHTACTFTTTKWPALAAGGLVLVRVSAGRDGDDRPSELDDGELVARLHREVAGIIGATDPPIVTRVDRWPASFPQYDVGHQDRVEAVDAALAATVPGVVVAGAAYRGLGIASCIAQAREVAARLLTALPQTDLR